MIAKKKSAGIRVPLEVTTLILYDTTVFKRVHAWIATVSPDDVTIRWETRAPIMSAGEEQYIILADQIQEKIKTVAWNCEEERQYIYCYPDVERYVQWSEGEPRALEAILDEYKRQGWTISAEDSRRVRAVDEQPIEVDASEHQSRDKK